MPISECLIQVYNDFEIGPKTLNFPSEIFTFKQELQRVIVLRLRGWKNRAIDSPKRRYKDRVSPFKLSYKRITLSRPQTTILYITNCIFYSVQIFSFSSFFTQKHHENFCKPILVLCICAHYWLCHLMMTRMIMVL
jgi:hypothetical protein